jgi:hypothetical protein
MMLIVLCWENMRGNEKDRIQIEKPDCDEEDWQALNELRVELRKRR